MFETDSPGSVDGRFSEGNASTGQVATRVSADWLNMVQDELKAVLTAAGITPDRENNTQVAQALAQSVSGFVDLVNPQTVGGVKTFGSFPVLPATAPSEATEAVNKGYVDGVVGTAVSDALQAPSGIIEGMQISRSGTNELRIERGTVQILGERYTLPAPFTLTALTGPAFGWNAVRVAKPPSGRELALFSPCPVANIARGSSNVWWHAGHPDDWLVIGIYPFADNDVIANFKTTSGLYRFYRQMVDDSSPPTRGWSDPPPGVSYGIGLPNLGEDVVGNYVGIANAENATSVLLGHDDSESEISVHVDGTLGRRRVWGPINITSADGTAPLHVATDGTANIMRLRMFGCGVPSGMAR